MTEAPAETGQKPFEPRTYFAMALDPIHVGTGGYRLGRVDNTIAREPGTNVPKIPGSSISGVTRTYTAMAVQSSDPANEKKMKFQTIRENGVVDSCAGKGARDGEGHCGKAYCEVCVPFGFSKKNSSIQGLAQFFDARILFFPVYSMLGPVWITSPTVLASFGIECSVEPEKFSAVTSTTITALNFGWLMLEKGSATPLDPNILDQLKLEGQPGFNSIQPIIKDKIYILPDNLFSQVINDNLEVRTSVAIDPATGAAESGALFTYEAIPRATIMWFDVVYNDPKYFRVDSNEIKKNDKELADIDWLETNVKLGLKFMESLGVGGMNTRGMGRLKVFI